jgi:H+/Na+-translocating ferredoxin:NAD+ oxidoreductase subunit G
MSERAEARPVEGEAWPMYRAMVGIGLICGVLLVGAFQLTKPIIERNKAEALARAIFQVLPSAKSSKSFVLGDDGRFTPLVGKPAGQTIVYGGYDGEGRLVGVAVEASGMGYQDTIRLLYGYAAEQNAIVGMTVLDSKETPGLGDKILSDADFLANFVRLDVALRDDGAQLSHAIVSVKHGTKSQPWQIDAITGATVSSNAIANILNGSAARVVPRIRAHLDDLRGAE